MTLIRVKKTRFQMILCIKERLYGDYFVLLQPFKRTHVSTVTSKEHAQALYLQGNAFRKQQQWAEALNAYEVAIALDPESPAVAARQMLMSIMDYYCKEYYNP